MADFHLGEDFTQFEKVACIRKELHELWDTPRRWKMLRDYYALVTPSILAGDRIDVYDLGLLERQTPIEKAVWQEIRSYGLPFYMQYPVGRRFVDFGDPVRKVAIEADGKQFHTFEKDLEKTLELKADSWTVFRIRGGECFQYNALGNVLEFYGMALETEQEAY